MNKFVKNLTDSELEKLIISTSRVQFDLPFLKFYQEKYSEIPAENFIDFFYKAQLTGADPRLNHVHLVTHKIKKFDEKTKQISWEREATTVYNYLFLIQKAEETERLDGFDSRIETVGNKTFGVATVWRKDWSHPVTVRCELNEFIKLSREGKPIGSWSTMPLYMLEKCALANAIRRAFPSLSAIYIEEEMVRENEIKETQRSEIKRDVAHKEPVITNLQQAELSTTHTAQELESEQFSSDSNLLPPQKEIYATIKVDRENVEMRKRVKDFGFLFSPKNAIWYKKINELEIEDLKKIFPDIIIEEK